MVDGDYWRPRGLPFAVGMALHGLFGPGPGGSWARPNPFEQLADERRYPTNLFIQNAREADQLMNLHLIGCAMPCHDRPESFVRSSGAYGRPDGGLVRPHALIAWRAPASTPVESKQERPS